MLAGSFANYIAWRTVFTAWKLAFMTTNKCPLAILLTSPMSAFVKAFLALSWTLVSTI